MKEFLDFRKETLETIKVGELLQLNEKMISVCTDMDPDQYIDEQYKHKHDPIFCWRFLRLISYIDIVNFHGKPQEKNKKFEGDIEEQAGILQRKGFKRDIVQKQADEDVEMQTEAKNEGEVEAEQT